MTLAAHSFLGVTHTRFFWIRHVYFAAIICVCGMCVSVSLWMYMYVSVYVCVCVCVCVSASWYLCGHHCAIQTNTVDTFVFVDTIFGCPQGTLLETSLSHNWVSFGPCFLNLRCGHLRDPLYFDQCVCRGGKVWADTHIHTHLVKTSIVDTLVSTMLVGVHNALLP